MAWMFCSTTRASPQCCKHPNKIYPAVGKAFRSNFKKATQLFLIQLLDVKALILKLFFAPQRGPPTNLLLHLLGACVVQNLKDIKPLQNPWVQYANNWSSTKWISKLTFVQNNTLISCILYSVIILSFFFEPLKPYSIHAKRMPSCWMCLLSIRRRLIMIFWHSLRKKRNLLISMWQNGQ